VGRYFCDRPWGIPSLLPTRTWDYAPGGSNATAVKLTAEVTNAWSCTYIFPYVFMMCVIKSKDNCIFLSLSPSGVRSLIWLMGRQHDASIWSPLVSNEQPVQWVPAALSPGVKRPGRESNHSHVLPWTRMVELYLYSRIRLHDVVLN
jgi:hypothetical protein